MKTTIIIKNNFKEIVLTPEDETEKEAIDLIVKKDYSVGVGVPDRLVKGLKAYRGEFYHCEGGWMREGSGDDSLILVFDDKRKSEV